MILKKQQEEHERQAKVSLRLKEQQNKMNTYVLEQQSSLELEELAEEDRKKLAEIELKGLELEDELSERIVRVTGSNLSTTISLMLL